MSDTESRQVRRANERAAKKATSEKYPHSYLFGSDEHISRLGEAIRAQQFHMVTALKTPPRDAETFGNVAVTRFRKALSRHTGGYSKYDGQGIIRTPAHLR